MNHIHQIRGQKVMIDHDLAFLYGVETKRLKEAVRRNMERFPVDFMFEMSEEELENQRSQIASFNRLKYRPFCFTEQGVTMLACILNSPTAVEMNIRIIRLFTKMREVISSNREILLKLELIERKLEDHDDSIKTLFRAIHTLLEREVVRTTSGEIGFTRQRD